MLAGRVKGSVITIVKIKFVKNRENLTVRKK